MKCLLFILLLVPFLSFGQNKDLTSLSNFAIENKEVQWSNVYQLEGLSSDDIYKKLKGFVPTISSVTSVQMDNDLIFGEIKNLKVDASKYGGSNFESWMPVGFPMDGKFLIQIKEGRYRVVVTDLYCHVTSFPNTFAAYALRKQNTQFAKSSLVQEGIEYINKELTSRFQLNQNALKSDW